MSTKEKRENLFLNSPAPEGYIKFGYDDNTTFHYLQLHKKETFDKILKNHSLIMLLDPKLPPLKGTTTFLYNNYLRYYDLESEEDGNKIIGDEFPHPIGLIKIVIQKEEK